MSTDPYDRESIYEDPEYLERVLGMSLQTHQDVINQMGFRKAIANLAKSVMDSAYWQSRVVANDCPQPGWVGKNYVKNKSIVIVLQNPAAPPVNYLDTRNQRMMKVLSTFSGSPTVPNYEMLAEAFRRDATGENGEVPWPKWNYPVSKVIAGIFHSDEIAWLNTVKVRTPGTVGKDDPVISADVREGIKHLTEELAILKPVAIVAIGETAYYSSIDITPTTPCFFLKQRPHTRAEHVAIIREAIRYYTNGVPS
jgi:hypothetical protein